MAIPIQIASLQVRGNVVRIAPPLASALGLRAGDVVAVQAGRRAVRCSVDVGGTEPNLVRVSRAVRRSLGLPLGLRIRIRRTENGAISLGPFFGIFARVIRNWPPYGDQNVDFRAHTAAGREHHVAVFTFGPKDILWKRRLIRARVAVEGSGRKVRWRRVTMPMPHVVWNRSYWPGKRRAMMRRTLRRFRMYHGAAIFNAGVGTKWHVYQHLAQHPDIQPHLPRTTRYNGIATVLRYLREFPGVYMKPIWGGWGIGVFRIRKVGARHFRISRTLGRRGVNVERVVGLAGLRQQLRRLVYTTYLVQQELLLCRIDDRIVDIRVLAQRRGDGEWGITGIAARAGRRRSVISNLHGGGHPLPFRDALEKMFPGQPDRIEEIAATVRSLALRIVRAVEEKYGRFGEIGLDFGVDQDGRVWFIEVNSRPGKNSFRILSPKEAWRDATRFPIEYGLWLTEFAPKGE